MNQGAAKKSGGPEANPRFVEDFPTQSHGQRSARSQGEFRHGLLALAIVLVLCLFSSAAAVAQGPQTLATHFRPNSSPAPSTPPVPEAVSFSFVVDDNSSEGSFGVAGPGATAQQFLWFNRFPMTENLLLEEIWVLFAPGPNMAVGNDIQLVVYRDSDSDPTNGATLLATYDQTIQQLDGTSFSIYPIPGGLLVPGGGDLLVGVINRFVVSGVTGTTDPATLDTTASLGQSWLAVWSGDPPLAPELPPDSLIALIDNFAPGNWMIRAFGTTPPVAVIPTLDPFALAFLAALLALAAMTALWRMRRRRAAAGR